MYADEGDDNADKYRITSEQGNNTLRIQDWDGTNWEDKIVCNNAAGVDLYHDNAKKLYTKDSGAIVDEKLFVNCTSNPCGANSEGQINISVSQGRDGVNLKHNHTGNCINLWRNNGAGAAMVTFYEGVNQTGVGTITVGSSSTAYNTSSDYRLKENEVAISDGITRLKTLKPYRFNFKNEPSKTVDGFFAHEVSPAVPEAITGEKDGTEMQGIDQSKIVPLLTAALQEAITKIETLETKVAALEAK